MAKNDDQRELRCSFCGKMQNQVQRLIAGPGVCICNECVELCQSVLEDGALEAIADKAIERKTGARGLRAILEETLGPLMYDTPSEYTIASVKITKGCVEGTEKPSFVYDTNRRPTRLQISTARRVPARRRETAS